MKLSLISATSVLALLAVNGGSANAGVLTSPERGIDTFGTAQNGMVSLESSADAASTRAPVLLAIRTLASFGGGWSGNTSTGLIENSVSAGFGPSGVPAGAAAGTKRDDSVASSVLGVTSSDPMEMARAVGTTRLAALIGSVGTGDSGRKGLSFVDQGGLAGFNDRGNLGNATRGTSMASVFAPRSSSTATITIAGAGNLSHPYEGSSTYMADGKAVEATTLARGVADPSIQVSDNAGPAGGFRYAPVRPADAEDRLADSAGKKSGADQARLIPEENKSGVLARSERSGGLSAMVDQPLTARAQASTVRLQTSQNQAGILDNKEVPAVFSSAVTVSGTSGRVASVEGPKMSELINPAKARTGQAAGSVKTYQSTDAGVTYKQLLEFTRAQEIARNETASDGTKIYISASVSADPQSNVIRFLGTMRGAVGGDSDASSVEAFLIGSPSRAKNLKVSTISQPLGDRVMASAGPLNSTLALP